MKKFVFKTSFFISTLFLIIVGVNYFGDPAKIFHSDFEKNMVEILSDGYFVTNIMDYDERIFQKELIENSVIRPDVIVLGSSRAMLINSTYFPNRSFYNSSVSSASLEDLIAIYQVYVESNIRPKKIVFGIDPWIFNENNGLQRWKTIESYYYSYQRGISTKKQFSIFDKKYAQLFSLSYFQSSITSLIKESGRYSAPKATKNKFNETNTKLLDGVLVYGTEKINVSQEEINRRIADYVKNEFRMRSLANFNSISSNYWNVFSEFISDLREKETDILFFLAPYAPLVYDEFLRNYPMVIEVEGLIEDFALNHDIELLGSFNPDKLGLDSTYFYDGLHCKEKAIDLIFSSN